MDREIKFRAWDDTVKRRIDWPDMVFVQLGDLKKINIMQYTGFKDKNGKEVYEGDVVEFVDLPNGDAELCIGEVIFEEFGWHFTNSITESSLECYESESVEVIGNIYENPELIE